VLLAARETAVVIPVVAYPEPVQNPAADVPDEERDPQVTVGIAQNRSRQDNVPALQIVWALVHCVEDGKDALGVRQAEVGIETPGALAHHFARDRWLGRLQEGDELQVFCLEVPFLSLCSGTRSEAWVRQGEDCSVWVSMAISPFTFGPLQIYKYRALFIHKSAMEARKELDML
jgi:hypothetical protein